MSENFEEKEVLHSAKMATKKCLTSTELEESIEHDTSSRNSLPVSSKDLEEAIEKGEEEKFASKDETCSGRTFLYKGIIPKQTKVLPIDKYEGDVEDVHTFYMATGYATHEQVCCLFERILAEIKKFIPDLDMRFRINLFDKLKDKSNPSLGRVVSGQAFAYLKDARAYHVILGKNPDGTPRICLKEKTDEKKEEKKEGDLSSSTRWADLEDEDTVKTCITVNLESMIDMSSFRIDNNLNQQKIMDLEFISKGITENIPTSFGISIFPANVKKGEIQEAFRENVLYINHVDPSVTEEDLHEVFDFYSTSKDTRFVIECRKSYREFSYPFIEIFEGKTPEGKISRYAWIVFERMTNDADFALYMTRTFMIQKNFKGMKANFRMNTSFCQIEKYQSGLLRLQGKYLNKSELRRIKTKDIDIKTEVVEGPAGPSAWGKKLNFEQKVEEEKKEDKKGKRVISDEYFREQLPTIERAKGRFDSLKVED